MKGFLIFLAIASLASGCVDSREPPPDYLLRVGSRQVTVPDFEQALEISKIAYPWEPEGHPELLWIIRRRLLVEMIEELLIFERADELGIRVTEKEVDDYVAGIRADYPEGAFEDIFLEQAISYESWRKKTRERLLLRKVVEADLVPQAGAPSPAAPAPGPDGAARPAAGEAPGRYSGIPASLDSDGRYKKWIGALAARIPVEINTELWKKLYGS